MYRQVRVISRSPQTIQWNQLRSVAQLNTKGLEDKPAAGHSKEWANAKPVTEIPGPTKLQLVRGFLPGGIFYKKTLIEFSLVCREMYGDLYAVPGVFGKENLLISFNPDDFPKILRSESIWPKRSGLETMNYHRSVHRKDDFGEVVGLLGSNNEAWGKLRTAVNPILMQPRNARLYLNKMIEVNSEFLERIREIRDPNTLEVPDTFEDEINRLTFESVAVIALNRQIGLIRKDRNNEEASRLFKSLRSIFELSFELDVLPSMWRIVKTPKFNEIIKAYDTMYDIIMKYVNQAVERIENDEKSTGNENEEKSMLAKLLKIDKNVAVVMALDMLMAGVDTTSTTLVGVLLCIAKNPEKQEKLRQEIRAILPQKDSQLTMDNMKNLPYLRACIKEGVRLYPIGSGVARSNGEDIVLSGYQVPKHHDIIVNANLLLKEEKHYPNAEQFIPERWLRDDNANQQMNPFLYIPFGFGARSCVGKRIVEMELEITVARLVRNFYLEFNYPTEKAFKNYLINVPAIPLNFKFSEVEN